jgi:CubicO group peptidase (beta-lactamase class C family)
MIGCILMAIMVDRGYLNYDEKVWTYWLEFANNGKGEVTVKDIMKHESGLEKFD